jgi:hypothetical protein
MHPDTDPVLLTYWTLDSPTYHFGHFAPMYFKSTWAQPGPVKCNRANPCYTVTNRICILVLLIVLVC